MVESGASGSGAENASGSRSGSGLVRKVKVARRNYPGNRSDIGWQHGVDVDGNGKRIKCNYCNKVVSGGIYRFKHHLAATKANLEACISTPYHVRADMLQLLFNDTSEISKTAEKVFDMLDEVVEKVREENAVQVITENAANYKAAGLRLMEKRKHLY
ncbi:uncharacterized protein G2W53_009563 [Senna tora]|uniref:BED-type domain-containing protein n=1 Tax=Senna tora TaxID=362788 RepID=A0A835C8E1_9FABA|nr:uncharacterized protein G2W53_009563 [Senna tora]